MSGLYSFYIKAEDAWGLGIYAALEELWPGRLLLTSGADYAES